MKTYSSKSNAVRALKNVDGFKAVLNEDGKWCVVKDEVITTIETVKESIVSKIDDIITEAVTEAQANLKRENAKEPTQEEIKRASRMAWEKKNVTFKPEVVVPATKAAKKEVVKAEPKPVNTDLSDINRKSSIEKPTKTVWRIADEMKKANKDVRRKEVIDECVKRGIAYYTARTQYQQWLTANKAS